MESSVVAPIRLHLKRFQSNDETGLHRSGELSYVKSEMRHYLIQNCIYNGRRCIIVQSINAKIIS